MVATLQTLDFFTPMRTLLFCLVCVVFVAVAVKDCDRREDRRTLLLHAGGGLCAALFFWWVLAYQIGVFSYR